MKCFQKSTYIYNYYIIFYSAFEMKKGVNNFYLKLFYLHNLLIRFYKIIIYKCKSIIYLIIIVKTETCITNPNIVGHPLFDIVPNNLDNNEFVKLYVNGLSSKTNTSVV